MRVGKMFKGKKEHIVEVVSVGPVRFAPGEWILVRDMDKPWHATELYWVEPAEVSFEWIKEFSE